MTKQKDLSDMPDSTSDKLTNIKMIILLNLAAVKLKKKDYRNVIEYCNEVSKYSNK